MKRLLLLIMIAVIICVCGSCSMTGSDYTAYLTAPKATGDMSEIADAFYDFAGNDILLSYPKRGDHLSAFVLEDIDGDGSKEWTSLAGSIRSFISALSPATARAKS